MRKRKKAYFPVLCACASSRQRRLAHALDPHCLRYFVTHLFLLLSLNYILPNFRTKDTKVPNFFRKYQNI